MSVVSRQVHGWFRGRLAHRRFAKKVRTPHVACLFCCVVPPDSKAYTRLLTCTKGASTRGTQPAAAAEKPRTQRSQRHHANQCDDLRSRRRIRSRDTAESRDGSMRHDPRAQGPFRGAWASRGLCRGILGSSYKTDQGRLHLLRRRARCSCWRWWSPGAVGAPDLIFDVVPSAHRSRARARVSGWTSERSSWTKPPTRWCGRIPRCGARRPALPPCPFAGSYSPRCARRVDTRSRADPPAKRATD